MKFGASKIKDESQKNSFKAFPSSLNSIIMPFYRLGLWYWQIPTDSVLPRFLVNLQLEPKMVIENRNLSEYSYGGILHPCFTPVKECEASENRAGDFILKHWQNKKRAYIIVEYQGADVEEEKHLFIEPRCFLKSIKIYL